MMGRVIREYFGDFRWQRVKETYKKDASFWVIYLLVLYPLMTKAAFGEEGILTTVCVLVPVVFTMFSESLHNKGLPKQMYLCPMSREMRKDYIIKSYCVRVAASFLVGTFGVIGLFVSRQYATVCVVAVWLNITLLSVFMSGHPGKNVITEKWTMNYGTGFLEWVLVVMGMGIGMIHSSMLTPERFLYGWVFIVIELAVHLPLTVFYMIKRWPLAIERALVYEQ